MRKIIQIIIIFVLTLVSSHAFAADISLYADQNYLKTGDEFTLNVLVHSTESINAVEGQLIYAKEILEIKEIRDGNSVINFWIQKPTNTSGVINFSGITPAGGFKGSNQKIFSVVFTAKEIGETSLFLDNVKILLDDGQGTNSVDKIIGTTIAIEEGGDNNKKDFVSDTESPEHFNPIITSNENIFNGKNFLVFATQDKESGISHYEIKEGWFSFYKKAESPYLLKNQKLNKKIYIKAFDLNENERLVIMDALNPDPWYKQFAIFGLLLVAIIIFLIKRIHAKIF